MLARMQEDGSTLAEWLAGPPGRALLDQERAAMAEALECVFGVQCLQVGAWGPPGEFLDLARTQRRAWLSAGASVTGAIRSDPANLPIQSDSIDALILPHTLEFASDPHQVLRRAAWSSWASSRWAAGPCAIACPGADFRRAWSGSCRSAVSPTG
jgi:hypothetical protein